MRSKRRSFLTIASAATSLCSLGTLMAIYNAFYFGEAPPQEALRLITRNRVSPAISLPISHRNKIERIPGVVDIMPFLYFGGVYKEPRNIFARYAVDAERLFTVHSEYVVAEEQKRAFQRAWSTGTGSSSATASRSRAISFRSTSNWSCAPSMTRSLTTTFCSFGWIICSILCPSGDATRCSRSWF
jgi:hypothetical protein